MGPTLKGKEKEILGAVPRTQALKGVKIAVRDLKDVDKAGGVEGLLVCSAPIYFKPVANLDSCLDRQRISRRLGRSFAQSCSSDYIWNGKDDYSSRSRQRYERD
jgi:hypothetical protein